MPHLRCLANTRPLGRVRMKLDDKEMRGSRKLSWGRPTVQAEVSRRRFPMESIEIPPYIGNMAMSDAYMVAESLARASMMTSPMARRRLQARKAEMSIAEDPSFVPPRQLLLYLVRMGSFTSAPKIENEDIQDNDLELPERMTKEDLLTYCSDQLKGSPQLISRTFSDFSPLTPCESSSSSRVRILQWNLLSQTLGVNNDNFVNCPDEALKWSRRKNLVTAEIVKYSPDIICLQEVDHFNYLKKTLSTQGYEGLFFPKPDSPCVYKEGNNGPDGCAIFYLTDKFEVVHQEARILEVWTIQSNQVAIVTLIKNRLTGAEMCIATTHLKARSGALLAALRNEQGKDLLTLVRRVAGSRPTILCGDFNAEPSEAVYSTVVGDESLRLDSAYASFHGSEPPYTTWKMRQDGEVCHTIDYIFFSKDQIRVLDTLRFPTAEQIGENRVPSMTYPSDHFSLVCDFDFSSNATQ